jgi:hypothetical protein
VSTLRESCGRKVLRATILSGALLSSACRDLGRFDTRPGEAYCGSMVSARFVRGGLLPRNEGPSLNMRLTLDTARLDTIPGTISTDDQVRGFCAPLPLFQDAPLRAIEQVASDDLSLLEFGAGRDLNFLAWLDSSCTQTMLAVVSLMKDDSVEIRLLKPAPQRQGVDAANAQPGFGIFRLHHQKGDCGI